MCWSEALTSGPCFLWPQPPSPPEFSCWTEQLPASPNVQAWLGNSRRWVGSKVGPHKASSLRPRQHVLTESHQTLTLRGHVRLKRFTRSPPPWLEFSHFNTRILLVHLASNRRCFHLIQKKTASHCITMIGFFSGFDESKLLLTAQEEEKEEIQKESLCWGSVPNYEPSGC